MEFQQPKIKPQLRQIARADTFIGAKSNECKTKYNTAGECRKAR